MDELFYTYYHNAEKGKQIMEDCYRNCGIESSVHKVILVFPDDDSMVLDAAYQYFDVFLKNLHYDVAIIISSIAVDMDYLRSITKVPLYDHRIGESEMEAVLRFASFAGDQNAIKVMSLKMPFNQKAEDLVGFKDITIDHLVYYCLYGLLSGEEIKNACR